MEEIQNGDSQSNDHKEFDFNVTGLDFILNISLKEGSWRLRVFVLVTFANPIQKKKKKGNIWFSPAVFTVAMTTVFECWKCVFPVALF